MEENPGMKTVRFFDWPATKDEIRHELSDNRALQDSIGNHLSKQVNEIIMSFFDSPFLMIKPASKSKQALLSVVHGGRFTGGLECRFPLTDVFDVFKDMYSSAGDGRFHIGRGDSDVDWQTTVSNLRELSRHASEIADAIEESADD